jgi:hypothetical protein
MRLISEDTCTKAWLSAASHLIATPNWREYTIVLEIANPMSLPQEDKMVYEIVDGYLGKHQKNSLSTVINTIFPATLYVHEGGAGLFDRYNELWPKIKSHPDVHWGTYFHRMTTKSGANGAKTTPLLDIINKLSGQLATSSPKRAAYEMNLCDVFTDLPIYDACIDGKPIMGGPCLSHLSFKLKDDRSLMLTAFYRSHYYVERALGNLFGLAWLQHFVAKEIGAESAELICISSMATLDTDGMTKGDVRKLISKCLSEMPQTSNAPAATRQLRLPMDRKSPEIHDS